MPGRTLLYGYSTKPSLPVPNQEELEKPWTGEILGQVRTGKVHRLYNLPISSAIYKSPHKEPVKVTFLGIEGDDHDYIHHGGIDKAIHQYCSSHYETSRIEYPESIHRFTVGGFGENLVSRTANERNVCIRDIIRIGDTVRIEVALPRAPCYKLNHRFEVKGMSKKTQDMCKTGWYCRVLTEGYIKAGDYMSLESRSHPEWTIAAVMHYLYTDQSSTEAMKALLELEPLGEEVKKILSNRLKKG